jgi:HK97 family phage major capsid protein
MPVKTRREEMAELRMLATGVLESADGRALTDDERKQLDDWELKADALYAEQAVIDKQKAELSKWEARIVPPAESKSTALTPVSGSSTKALAKTIGQQLTDVPGFMEYKARKLPYTVELEVKAVSGITYPDIPLLADTALSTVQVVSPPVIPFRVSGLMGQAQTDSGAVPYMRVKTFTSTPLPVAIGAAKPLATMEPEMIWAPVVTIAHLIVVPNQLLEDAPAFRSTIETKMLNALIVAEDNQLLNGAGTGGALQGLNPLTGLQAPVAGVGPAYGDAILQQYMNILANTYIQPTGIVMSPTAFIAVVTSKAATGGNYFLVGVPFDRSPFPLSVWGLPVVISPSEPANEALVGAFRTETIVYRHGGVRIAVSESHEDVFAKNCTAIRVEERIAFAIYTPAAFGKVTGLGGGV